MAMSCPEDSILQLSSYTLPVRGGDTDVLFRAEYSVGIYFLHFDQLWVSILITAQCKVINHRPVQN